MNAQLTFAVQVNENGRFVTVASVNSIVRGLEIADRINGRVSTNDQPETVIDPTEYLRW